MVITYGFWFLYVYVLQNDLFYFHPWIDIPFHIGGGIIIALLMVLIVLFRHSDLEILTLRHFWFQALWGTMMIGVVWEYYEYWFKLNGSAVNVTIDTLSDLLNDFIGATIGLAVGYGLVKLFERKHTQVKK